MMRRMVEDGNQPECCILLFFSTQETDLVTHEEGYTFSYLRRPAILLLVAV